MYLSFYWFQSTFLSTAWHLSLSSGKGNQIFYLVRFYFYFIAVITIIVVFLNFNTHSPPCFENNSMKILKSQYFCFCFSGSVDTIVFSKTGNHLLQCLWFSNSFFTVDGCIDCVKGILNS